MLVINELYVLQKSPVHPILQRLPLATLQASIGVEQTKNCFSPSSISMAILLRSSSHKSAVFFLGSLNCIFVLRLESPDSLMRFSENCLHISSILTNFV